MRILAIHPGHCATVALLENGEISAVLSQEKIDNQKNSSAFPAEAVKAVLSSRGLSASDIDEIAITGNQVFPAFCYEYLTKADNQNPSERGIEFAKKLEKSVFGTLFPWVFRFFRKARLKSLLMQGERELKKELEKLGFGARARTHVEHHLCHARSAFHALNKEKENKAALIFTLDGSGDGLCATVTRVDSFGDWERLAVTPARSSLGGIYSLTTRFLGMKILEHEYKVMGLAPYSKNYHRNLYQKIFSPVIWLDKKNPLVFKTELDSTKFYNYLVQNAVGERFDNIAGALQLLLEERVTEWIGNAIKATGIRRIFTGGGVFMNVKLNKKIQEMELVEKVSFMPSCGDESNPIGAAYELAIRKGISVKPLENLYLGIGYSDEALKKFISENQLENKYRIIFMEDPAGQISSLLAEGEIVARFAGRCEWGARSLGNRAILANPSLMESFYTVNDLIKSRDFWMPFAPTILDISAEKYLEKYNPQKVDAPYMITAFDATPLGKKHLKAALHRGDHTLRPQVLTEDFNPPYYRLIKAFKKKTNIGGVLNTSFNLHGYPLVATPEQALFTFENSGLLHLALGSYLISK